MPSNGPSGVFSPKSRTTFNCLLFIKSINFIKYSFSRQSNESFDSSDAMEDSPLTANRDWKYRQNLKSSLLELTHTISPDLENDFNYPKENDFNYPKDKGFTKKGTIDQGKAKHNLHITNQAAMFPY